MKKYFNTTYIYCIIELICASIVMIHAISTHDWDLLIWVINCCLLILVILTLNATINKITIDKMKKLESIKCGDKNLIVGKSIKINFANDFYYSNKLIHVLSIMEINHDIYIMFKYWDKENKWYVGVAKRLVELEKCN